jgi:starvation-inducible DNA-binding protein
MNCECHQNSENAPKAACPVKVYLANLAVWTAKLHNLHWNVVGPAFLSLHEYTEKLYEETFEQMDSVAEAMKMRGGMPPVRLAEFLELASLKEAEAKNFTAEEVLGLLFEDMSAMNELARQIRKGADKMGDDQLVGLFDGFIGYFDKQLWFISAMRK